MSTKHPTASPPPELPKQSADQSNRAFTYNAPVLNTRQAADYLNIQPATLEQWRWSGRGPRYCKIGRSCRYRVADLDAFLDARVFRSTTEAGRSSHA